MISTMTKVTKLLSGVRPFALLTMAAREMEPAVGTVEKAAAAKLHSPMAARTGGGARAQRGRGGISQSEGTRSAGKGSARGRAAGPP